MPIPSLTDAQIKAYQALYTAVMNALRDRDRWNYDQADNNGSGIDQNVLAFGAALLEHSHDGTDGQGEQIGTAGIATGAVNLSSMIDTAPPAISQAKVANATMQNENFALGSVTSEKIYHGIGSAVSGTWDYDFDSDPPLVGTPHDSYKGETKVIANPLGRLCIVTPGDIDPAKCGECHIRSITSSEIRLGLNEQLVLSRYGAFGTANYSIVCT